MYQDLRIIHWPDPRLLKVSRPVKEFTPALRDLSVKMFELMREAKGVGLAAPQVGENIRMFVMNGTGEPSGDRAYVNPVLSEPDAEDAAEEGCLSLPTINTVVTRSRAMRMQAQDLEGNPIDEIQSGYIARIWQHETDHLNGVLITDRMSLADKLKYRKTLREMEEKWQAEHPAPAKKTARQKTR